MSRYEKENAAHRVDGYYGPTPAERVLGKRIDAFERAKDECLKHMRDNLAQTEALTSDEFFSITKRK